MPPRAQSAPVSATTGDSAAHVVGRALLFLHLALSPLVFSAATVEVFEYNKVAILTITALLLSGGALALGLGRVIRKEPFAAGGETWTAWAGRLWREPVALGFGLFFLSSLASTFISINVRTSIFGAHESFAGIFTMASYLVLFVATRELCKDSEHWRLLFFAAVFGIAFSGVYGVMQLTGLDPIRWGRTSGWGGITRVFATMGHPNFLSGYHATAFPIAAYFAVRSFRKGLWPLGIAISLAAALSEGMVIISISRGAWLAFGAMFAVLFIGWVVCARDWKGALGITGANIGAFVIAVALLASFPDGQEVLKSMKERMQQLLNTSAMTHESRSYIWAAAVQMFKDHPLFGIGLDNFQLAFEQYRSVAYWHSEWNGTPTKAHNEALHILAMQGAFGGIAMALIVGGTGIAFWRALRRGWVLDKDITGIANRDPLDRALLVAVFAGAVGFFVQDLVSFTVAGCGTIFVTFAACLSRWGDPRPHVDDPAPAYEKRIDPELAAGSLAASALVALLTLWSVKELVVDPYIANSKCRSGASLLQAANRPDLAVLELRDAVAIDPTKELYWVRLGTACQMQARNMNDPTAKAAMLREARDAYQMSIDLVPINSYNWANLGRLLADMARERPPLATQAQVFAAFEKALEIDPNNAYFYADGANSALSFGDLARARRWSDACAEKYPQFAPAFAQKGYLLLREAEMLSATGQVATATARFAEAADMLERSLKLDWMGDEPSRGVAQSNFAAALIRAGQYPRALGAAREAVGMNPGYIDAQFNFAKALELTGDLDQAHANYVKALQMQPGHSLSRKALKDLRKQMQMLGKPLPPLPPAVQKALDETP